MVSYLPTIKIFSSNWKMKKYSVKLVDTSKETPTGIIPAWGKTNIMNSLWIHYQYHEFTIICSNSLWIHFIILGIKIDWKLHKNMDFLIKNFIFIKVSMTSLVHGQYGAIWGHEGPFKGVNIIMRVWKTLNYAKSDLV